MLGERSPCRCWGSGSEPWWRSCRGCPPSAIGTDRVRPDAGQRHTFSFSARARQPGAVSSRTPPPPPLATPSSPLGPAPPCGAWTGSEDCRASQRATSCRRAAGEPVGGALGRRPRAVALGVAGAGAARQARDGPFSAGGAEAVLRAALTARGRRADLRRLVGLCMCLRRRIRLDPCCGAVQAGGASGCVVGCSCSIAEPGEQKWRCRGAWMMRRWRRMNRCGRPGRFAEDVSTHEGSSELLVRRKGETAEEAGALTDSGGEPVDIKACWRRAPRCGRCNFG